MSPDALGPDWRDFDDDERLDRARVAAARWAALREKMTRKPFMPRELAEALDALAEAHGWQLPERP